MNWMDFYKEQYYRELTRRDELNASLSLPVGLITAMIASVFFLITHFDYRYSLVLTILFSIFVIAFMAIVVVVVINLVRAYVKFPKKYEYHVLPDANLLNDHFIWLKQKHGEDFGNRQNADQKFRAFLLSRMIASTGVNQRNNRKKEDCKDTGELCLIYALIMLALVVFAFGINYAEKPTKNDLFEARTSVYYE
jgi:hypothetical protein